MHPSSRIVSLVDMTQPKEAQQPDRAPSKEQQAPVTRDENEDFPEKPMGVVVETVTASVALAAAMAESKPSPFSRQMLRLYVIMFVGYLVSTINGFGESCLRFF